MKMFAVGDRVVQAEYGAGTVTSADVRHTVIDFDNHGVRRFVTSMVSLTSTTEPAPVRPARGRSRAARSKA
ncbi:MAG TPA: hypothetical protein VIL35_09150 [Vicinamibacterales bacterium]